MTKIMLVEDDNNLREIYEARLAAEGYIIVSAQDGEAALALAAKERPALIITDVMMPKISGFEMLDILRNTEALRDVKVIMLTALGQAEDSARAGALGADRYLVKSQVTLEDIVKATHEVLGTDSTQTQTQTATTSANNSADTAAYNSVVDVPLELPVQPVAIVEAEVAVATQPFIEPSIEPQIVPASPADAIVVVNPAAPTQALGQPPLTDQAVVDTSVSSPQPAHDDKPATTAQDQSIAPLDSQSIVAGAEPIADQEAEFQAQIDSFLSHQSDDSNLPDEPDAEYDKDASTPDMGKLSVHPVDPTDITPPQESSQVSDNQFTAAAVTAVPPTVDINAISQTTAAQAPTAEPLSPPVDQTSNYGVPLAVPSPATAEPTPDASIPVTALPTAWSTGNPVTSDVTNTSTIMDSVSQPATVTATPYPASPTLDQSTQAYQPAPPPSFAYQPPVESTMPAPAELNPSVPTASYDASQQHSPEAQLAPPADGVSDSYVRDSQDAAPQAMSASPAASHKLVVAPLTDMKRPDINQLLAIEEAKVAALQTSQAQVVNPALGQQPPATPGLQTAAPTFQAPAPVQANQFSQPQSPAGPGFDPNSISL